MHRGEDKREEQRNGAPELFLRFILYFFSLRRRSWSDSKQGAPAGAVCRTFLDHDPRPAATPSSRLLAAI